MTKPPGYASEQAEPAPRGALASILTMSFITCLLGNFVDQFDLYLFSSLRVSSLTSLGLGAEAILHKGAMLLNVQLIGMLVGGILGGIVGDKHGRLSILFGSILLYSLANIANAFVSNVNQYLWCRFFAGIGLAGELGICITIVLETLPRHLRGYGTMLMIAFGHCATFLSSVLANIFEWRTCYFLGGCMGLAVLLMRTSIHEPAMYQRLQGQAIKRGDISRLWRQWSLFKRYTLGVLLSTPTWFTFSVLIIFAPEFGRELGITATIKPEHYLPFNFAAVIVGDFTSGLLAQAFKTRRWIILGFIVGLAATVGSFLFCDHLSLGQFYAHITIFGFFAGYAVQSYTAAAEQFGTNLRATVATSTPNLTRASAVLFTSFFILLKPSLGAIKAAALIAAISFFLAIVAAMSLEETFGKDLDYTE